MKSNFLFILTLTFPLVLSVKYSIKKSGTSPPTTTTTTPSTGPEDDEISVNLPLHLQTSPTNISLSDHHTIQIAGGNSQEKLSELQALSCEKKLVSAKLQTVESEFVRYETSIRYISSLIKLTKYKSAQNEFWNLENPVKTIGRIIEHVYTDKTYKLKYPAVKKILGFLAVTSNNSTSMSTSCHLFPAAISALKKEINLFANQTEETWLDQIPPEILLVSDKYLSFNCPTSTKIGSYSLDTFRNMTKDLLFKWRDSIVLEDFKEIQLFCKNPKAVKSFKRFLPEIVRSSYGQNRTNFGALEKFSVNLCGSHLSAMALNALLTELKKDRGGHNEEMLRFGFTVRKYGWDEGKKFDGKKDNENLYNKLRQGIAGDLGKMIWGGRCTIKNLKSGEYLYTGLDGETGETVLEMRKKKLGDGFEGGDGWWWQFHPFKKDKQLNDLGMHWLIKSTNWEMDKPYLCTRFSKKGRKKVNKKKGKKLGDRNGEASTCFKTGFKNKRGMMANWVLEPVTTRDQRGGVIRAFKIFTLNEDKGGDVGKKEEIRLDLFLEEIDNLEGEDGGGVNKVAYQLFGKEGMGKFEEGGFWQVECE